MSKIDFNELSAMQKETLWLSMKIKDMCTLGKRDQAEKEAKLFYDKAMNLPSIVQMQVCTQDFIPDFDLKQRHISAIQRRWTLAYRT